VIAPLPSDRLTTARPLAAHIGDTPKIPKPAALPRIDAPGKARSKRIPVSVLVGGAAAVLLLVFGLIFALADDPDEAQTKAAVPEPAPPDPRHVEASASPAPAQEPAGEQRPHGAGDEPKAGEEPEPSDAEPAEPAADSEEPAEAPAPPAKAVAQPRAVAPKPRANRRPVQRKRKAKRNFIPSGI
jgi:hypothetical protein